MLRQREYEFSPVFMRVVTQLRILARILLCVVSPEGTRESYRFKCNISAKAHTGIAGLLFVRWAPVTCCLPALSGVPCSFASSASSVVKDFAFGFWGSYSLFPVIFPSIYAGDINSSTAREVSKLPLLPVMRCCCSFVSSASFAVKRFCSCVCLGLFLS